jgi:hypothetical protein
MLPSGLLRFSLSIVTAPLIHSFVLFIYSISTLYILHRTVSCSELKGIRCVGLHLSFFDVLLTVHCDISV